MKVGRRRTWRNHTGNQRCQPIEVRRPESLGDIVQAVRDAEGAELTVRAVGSGHSWSDVALTTGILLLPQGLAGPLPLEQELLRAGAPADRLVRVGSGTRIRELNAHLDANGLALSNMGGYDGQTIAGVLSTSTHGSGLRFGPLADMARSLELVCSAGACCASSAPPGRPIRRRSRAPGTGGSSSRTTRCSTPSSSAWAAWASCTP